MNVEVEVVERSAGRIALKGEVYLLSRKFEARVACEGDEKLVSIIEKAARSKSPELLEPLRSEIVDVRRELQCIRIRLARGECVVSGDGEVLNVLFGFLRRKLRLGLCC